MMTSLRQALLNPERAVAHRRPTWVSLVGLVLVPLVFGGLLTWALWQPTRHLDRMTAAVVNLDSPVEVDGQLVPLGRQLSAALVTSSTGLGDEASDDGTVRNVAGSDSTENFTWVLTDAEDATDGLTTGRYVTVVTIPEDFSAAATSAAGDSPVRARIDIATSERSRLVDSAVAQAVTTTAAGLLGDGLTTTSLTNVLLGFTTLNESLGQAADGAHQLADGAGQVADGTTQAASGAGELAGGLDQLATGTDGLADGISALATGAGDLADGLDQLADGTATSAQQAAAGAPQAQAFADGLAALDAGVNGPGGLATGVDGLATGTAGMQGLVSGVLAQASQLALGCQGGDPVACATLVGLLQSQQGTAPVQGNPTLTGLSQQLAGGAAALDSAVSMGTATAPALSTSVSQLAVGGARLASGAGASAAGLGTLSDYLRQSADGAAALADGAVQAAVGASQLAEGSRGAATGADDLASGVTQLGSGAGEVADGVDQLASGLDEAVAQVPTYTDAQATTMAEVLAAPVATAAASDDLFGGTTVPYLVTLALWLGGLATFVVVGAVTRSALASTRSSAALTLRSFLPGAAVGVLQGLLITLVMVFALDLDVAGWVGFTSVAVTAGLAFAAVNQGLVAVLGGAGRLVSVVVAVVSLATSVISTVPPVLVQAAAGLPTRAALDGLLGAVTGQGGVGGAVALLAVWGLAGLALTFSAVARRRVVPAGQLARWVRAA
jgi:putative membrane protein